MKLWDTVLPMLTVTVLSPVAVVCFRAGIPIELIVFGLLVAGYKGPQLLTRQRKGRAGADGVDAAKHALEVPAPSSIAGGQAAQAGNAAGKAAERSGSLSWRAKIRSWGSGSSKSGADGETWRSKAPTDARGKGRARPDEPLRKESTRSALGGLKNNDPQQQWRGIINKFTPEKFDKLCEQLLATLPSQAGTTPVGDHEYKRVLEDMLALIFEACSRQHQYTEMYTNLCQKLLDYVQTQRPELDGKSCIWGKCQHIFLTMVLKPPEIPMDLPEDEYMDRKVKLKEKMVGMVKFGGDLVSRGLVPFDGVMQWMHTLLSEKTQEVYSTGAYLEHREDAEQDKEQEQREVQLELLCAILAGMGSSLADQNAIGEENRLVIEDVFMQLEQLSVDTARLSLRIRCLIRDILDLRMAQWKEREDKLKPGMLQRRKKEDDTPEVTSGLRGDAPEFVPGSDAAWTSDRMLPSEVRWLDPQLLSALQALEHHLEVIEDRESKLERLKRLIKFYNLIQEQQIVIVANSSSVSRISNLLGESFKDIESKSLDFSTPESVRKASLKGFEMGETSILVMASEVSTRRDFDFGKPCPVLVNFDFPMTLQLYLYRLFKRADSSTHVYTFFSTNDVRHTVPLMVALDGAGQKIPDALKRLKEQAHSESGKRGHLGSGRSQKGQGRQESRQDPKQDSEDACGDGGGKGRGKARASASDSWRDERTSSDSTSRQELRERNTRDSVRRQPDSPSDAQDADGGWQQQQHRRGLNQRRPPASGSKGQGGDGRPDDPAARSERAPWFEDIQGEPRRTGSFRGSASGGDSNAMAGMRASSGAVSSSASSQGGAAQPEGGGMIRQRRPYMSAEGSGYAGGDKDARGDVRTRAPSDACDLYSPPDHERFGRQPSGSDKQRDAIQQHRAGGLCREGQADHAADRQSFRRRQGVSGQHGALDSRRD